MGNGHFHSVEIIVDRAQKNAMFRPGHQIVIIFEVHMKQMLYPRSPLFPSSRFVTIDVGTPHPPPSDYFPTMSCHPPPERMACWKSEVKPDEISVLDTRGTVSTIDRMYLAVMRTTWVWGLLYILISTNRDRSTAAFGQ